MPFEERHSTGGSRLVGQGAERRGLVPVLTVGGMVVVVGGAGSVVVGERGGGALRPLVGLGALGQALELAGPLGAAPVAPLVVSGEAAPGVGHLDGVAARCLDRVDDLAVSGAGLPVPAVVAPRGVLDFRALAAGSMGRHGPHHQYGPGPQDHGRVLSHRFEHAFPHELIDSNLDLSGVAISDRSGVVPGTRVPRHPLGN